MATGGRAKGGRGRLWLVVHGWFALPIWLLLFVICVTGTLLTVAHELQWLVDPTVRAANPDGSAPKPLNEIVAAVNQAYPEGIVTRIRVLEPYLAHEVTVALPEAPFARAHVNPYTGAVQGLTEGPGFTGFLFGLHSWLLFPWTGTINLGWYIVTALGFFMAGSIVTGLVVYKKFWKAFTQPRLRLRNGARAFWGDFHRLAAMWALWFTLIIAVSGGWFLVVNLIYTAGYKIFPDPPLVAREDVPPPAADARRLVPDLDRAVAAARTAVPDFRPHYVVLPNSAYNHTMLLGDTGLSLFGKYGRRVFVNPYTDRVGGTILPGEMTALQVTSRILPALHFGNFGGLVTKLIWFVFGAALSALVFSGIVIWTKRTAQATVRAVRADMAPAGAAAE